MIKLLNKSIKIKINFWNKIQIYLKILHLDLFQIYLKISKIFNYNQLVHQILTMFHYKTMILLDVKYFYKMVC